MTACACAGVYGSQARDDYTEDDVEQYFNYMGMLADEVRAQAAPFSHLHRTLGESKASLIAPRLDACRLVVKMLLFWFCVVPIIARANGTRT